MMMAMRLALAAALTHATALNASLPAFDNTCWDDDPLTPSRCDSEKCEVLRIGRPHRSELRDRASDQPGG